MAAISNHRIANPNNQAESPRPATRPMHQTIAPRKLVEAPTVAASDTAKRVVEFPVPKSEIPRHIDWYVQNRGLPPLIADFLDTHWRSYTMRCFLIEGEESESCREAVTIMKELAWSVRPKRESLSRRRLITLIPRLYQGLHHGLESLGFGLGAAEHDRFFAELTKLHQAVLAS